MQGKFVLDTCIVKDLLKYNKDKVEKINNGIDIKKVYDYITTMDFDGKSKCYLTIYTFYEVLKDFKSDFSKETFEFFELLYPQTITSPDIREKFNDRDLINIHSKTKKEQENILVKLRDLIAEKIGGFMAEIFITMLNIYIGLLTRTLDSYDIRKKQMKQTLQEIYTTIYNMLFDGLRINVEISKRRVVAFLNNEYKKLMKLVSLFLQMLENKKTVSYKNINKLLIIFNETLKNNEYKNKEIDENYDMFQSFYEWFKIYYGEKYSQTTENVVREEYKNIINYLIKETWQPFEKEVMNQYFYENIEKLFFRVIESNQPKDKMKDSTYGFGFDINDIIDMHILRLCLKGKYLQEDLRILTSDVRMRKHIDKFLPSSKILYEEFGGAKS